jgi:glucosamine--fructose-6-phosphate aminotransferase (isomerizing)
MPSGPAYADMRDLAQALAAGGARLVMSSDEDDVPAGAVRLPHTRVPEWLTPAVSILPVQRLALALAYARGLDPDRPRGLAEKVVRTV